jgi:hypothetical protein
VLDGGDDICGSSDMETELMMVRILSDWESSAVESTTALDRM